MTNYEQLKKKICTKVELSANVKPKRNGSNGATENIVKRNKFPFERGMLVNIK